MTLTAVLFVGGDSRRMGADKATLAWAGEPLWMRQMRTLQAVQPEALLVSARTRPDWCLPAVKTVLDLPPSRGPLSGLAAALKAVRTTHLLALAIDLPLVTGEHLLKLWSSARPDCGVVPEKAGRFEPLCAVYPAAAADQAAEALAGPDVSLQGFLRMLKHRGLIKPYPYTDEERPLYLNANTVADLPPI